MDNSPVLPPALPLSAALNPNLNTLGREKEKQEDEEEEEDEDEEAE